MSKLNRSSTLFDIIGSREDKIEYVITILKNMDAVKRECKTEIFVRVGIPCEGILPNYWVNHDSADGKKLSDGTYQSSKRAQEYETPVDAGAYSDTRTSIFDVRTGLKALRDAR